MEDMEELKNLIGEKWESEEDFGEDLNCCLPGEVEFGDEETIPFTSKDVRRMEIYNEEESYTVEYRKTIDEDGELAEIELLDVY